MSESAGALEGSAESLVPQHSSAEPPSEMGKSAENPPLPFLFRTSFLQATTCQDFSGTFAVSSACRGKRPLAVCWEPRASQATLRAGGPRTAGPFCRRSVMSHGLTGANGPCASMCGRTASSVGCGGNGHPPASRGWSSRCFCLLPDPFQSSFRLPILMGLLRLGHD